MGIEGTVGPPPTLPQAPGGLWPSPVTERTDVCGGPRPPALGCVAGLKHICPETAPHETPRHGCLHSWVRGWLGGWGLMR